MKKLLYILGGLILGNSAQAQIGIEMFDESYVHEIRIEFEDTVTYWDSLTYYYTDFIDNGAAKKYMWAQVTIDGELLDSVGVRQKGNYSNWGQEGTKKPLKLDFNEFVSGQKYDGLKKLNLANGMKDPSMMRDAVSYKFMRDAGIKAPRTSYSKVYINDIYWGLYLNVEQVDSRFLKYYFPEDEGDLYKCMNNTNLDYQGTNPIQYQDEFELKTNETTGDWNEFIHMVDNINNTPAADMYDSLFSVIDMNNYLEILASDVLLYNWDSYYDHGRNFYIYNNPEINKFTWIPWDYNLSFSNNGTNIIITYPQFGPFSPDPKPLVLDVMDDAGLKTIYMNKLCVLRDNYFNNANLDGYIDQTAALIRADLDADTAKFYTINEFDDNITSDVSVTTFDPYWGFPSIENFPGLKDFITDRGNTVTTQLNQQGHTCTTLGINDVKFENTATVFPNPGNTLTQIQTSAPSKVKVYNNVGKLIMQNNALAQQHQLNISDFAAGIYMIKIEFENETITQKLIIK